MSWMGAPNFLHQGQAVLFYTVFITLHILHIDPSLITGSFSITFFKLVAWMCMPNSIRLDQVVFAFYVTGHHAYILYMETYIIKSWYSISFFHSVSHEHSYQIAFSWITVVFSYYAGNPAFITYAGWSDQVQTNVYLHNSTTMQGKIKIFYREYN